MISQPVVQIVWLVFREGKVAKEEEIVKELTPESTSEEQVWIAHSEAYPKGPKHLLREHLTGVAELASKFAEPIGLKPQATVCALLHDLGKYGDLFQRRLAGLETGIDHWTAGAAAMLTSPSAVSGALAIQGHHIGLQSGSKAELRALYKLTPKPSECRLSSTDVKELLARAEADGISSEPAETLDNPLKIADFMLETRLLFSCLVDADYIDTEAHFTQTEERGKIIRPCGPPLDVGKAICALDNYMTRFTGTSVETKIVAMRNQLQHDCSVTASESPGIFTLTAPTGFGKTLAMLRFALCHAKHHGLRRVIVVLPFLNLIEETARIYREIFSEFPSNYVLEDHSLAYDPESHGDEQARNLARILGENWDAPIIITTNVRLLESLHGNRPGNCRKLHRLGQSVILMDEVQTLPTHLAVITLASLSALSSRFSTTIVFSTATQPAFDELNDAVSAYSQGGWVPREIVSDVAEFYRSSERVRIEWRSEVQSWEELADEFSSHKNAMTIVNLRKHASVLTTFVRERCTDSVPYHLSTNMVVEHRRQVLQSLRQNPGRLIATQCVEAGVDLDFRCVYRAWAPLDSVAQAAGRCNRNGKEELGNFIVFTPEDEGFPDGSYRQATQITRNLISQSAHQVLHDPNLFRKFYEQLYEYRGLGQGQIPAETEILDALKSHNYLRVAELYRLMPSSGVNIVIPTSRLLNLEGKSLLGERHDDTNATLIEQAKSSMTRSLMRKIRPYTVSTYLPENHNLPLLQLRLRDGQPIPGWFLLTDHQAYDPVVGLLTHSYQSEYIV
ncbi:CRISPR-associated helicase Cas3' [Kamptonema cortianum]|nr:CRISPR-associated helicase Cas3' [Kamptonema cortianum]